MKQTFWNLVSDFASVRFAIDACALASSFSSNDDALLSDTFRLEGFLEKLHERYPMFDLLFFNTGDDSRRRKTNDSCLLAHLRRNATNAHADVRAFSFT
jgi:hypothetical protein